MARCVLPCFWHCPVCGASMILIYARSTESDSRLRRSIKVTSTNSDFRACGAKPARTTFPFLGGVVANKNGQVVILFSRPLSN